MNKLTIVIPNKNRFDVNSPSSKLTLQSIQWQENQDFDMVVIDGGSSNYDSIKPWLESFRKINVMQNILDGVFNKPLLNNIAIQSAKTEYILCTDADLVFSKYFTQTVINNLEENTMIEARTLFWKDEIAKRVYGGEIDLLKNFDACRIGRIKYRTTCGGCQCLHKSKWELLRGYDETFVGWGSEDMDLLWRAESNGLKIKWLNEERHNIMLFHQPHHKSMDVVMKCLEYQEENKKKLFTKRIVNERGWGGIIST